MIPDCDFGAVRSAFFGQLSADQCMKVVQQMTIRDFAAGEALGGADLHLVLSLV